MSEQESTELENIEPEKSELVKSEQGNLELPPIVEALLLAAGGPLSIEQIQGSFETRDMPERKAVRDALKQLDSELSGRAVELIEVSSGFRIQVRQDFSSYVGKLWEERPPRFSRALLETLALIVYRQPISRGEIEEIRGVSLSPNIIKTLMEREWVKVVGVRETPGRPELLGTTKTFLDDFCLKNLDQLPSLPELRDLDSLGEALERIQAETGVVAVAESEAEEVEASSDVSESAEESNGDQSDETIEQEIVEEAAVEMVEEIREEDESESTPVTSA